MKPGSCTLPFYGIDAVVLDPVSGEELAQPDEHGHYEGVMCIRQPWPGTFFSLLSEEYLIVPSDSTFDFIFWNTDKFVSCVSCWPSSFFGFAFFSNNDDRHGSILFG